MKRSHIFIIEPAFISHMLFACSSHSNLISINRDADKRNVVLLLRVCVKSRWPKMVRSSWSYRTDETAPPSRCYLLCLCYWNYLWFWLGQVNTENNNNEHILSLIIMIWWNTKIEYMYSMRMHRFWHMHSNASVAGWKGIQQFTHRTYQGKYVDKLWTCAQLVQYIRSILSEL